MRDPNPENISGEKVQRHVFKHEINWGYVTIAAAVVVAVYIGYVAYVETDTEDDAHSEPNL